MENDFLRLHELNIWNMKLRHSKKFRFKSSIEYTKYTDQLIINDEPYVYRRFEDDYCREKLRISMSWTVIVFSVSFLLIFLAFLFIPVPIISFTLLIISILSFLSGIYLKSKYQRYAFCIDLARELLTDDLIEDVKRQLLSTQNEK